MKQLLLRVPEDLHGRLMARAEREGRSLNAVATAILDAAADADGADRRSQVRAAAAAAGVLHRGEARAVRPGRRERIIATTRGLGPRIDQALDDERDRP